MSRVNEVGGLREVNHLRECVVEEGVLDVNLVNGQPLETARVSIVWTVVGLMTGLKVSL
jgi:hypothetical protein